MMLNPERYFSTGKLSITNNHCIFLVLGDCNALEESNKINKSCFIFIVKLNRLCEVYFSNRGNIISPYGFG